MQTCLLDGIDFALIYVGFLVVLGPFVLHPILQVVHRVGREELPFIFSFILPNQLVKFNVLLALGFSALVVRIFVVFVVARLINIVVIWFDREILNLLVLPDLLDLAL